MTSRFQVPLGIWWGLEKDFSNWLSVCSQKEFSFSCSLYLWFIDTTPHFIYCSEAAAVSQTRTQPLGREDRLEKGTATHSVFLTGESQGQESLEGYSPRGCKQSDMTEQLSIAHTTQEKEKPYGNSNFDRIFRVSHLAHGRIIVNGTTYYQQ